MGPFGKTLQPPGTNAGMTIAAQPGSPATNLRTPRATNSTTPKSRMRREVRCGVPLERYRRWGLSLVLLARGNVLRSSFRCSIDAFDRAVMIGSSLRMNARDPIGRGLTSPAALPRLADDLDPATPSTDSCRGRRAARQRHPARPRRPRHSSEADPSRCARQATRGYLLDGVSPRGEWHARATVSGSTRIFGQPLPVEAGP
jgi:hypothetical protein